MNSIPELIAFFSAIKEDSRISPVHISLFMAIMQYWNDNNCKNPICVFSGDLMQLAKISGVATYHKCIRELNEYGYIKYKPTYNHFSKSQVYIQAPIKPN
jgi:hypothetical protein